MDVKNIILFNDYAYVSGGAAKVAFDAAIGLADHGFNVVFVSGTGPENNLLKEHGITSVCLHQPDMLSNKNKLRAAMRSIWNTKAHKTTLSLLEKYSPDDTLTMVHGFSKTLSSAIFPAINKQGFKCLYILHEYFAACPNGGFYDYQKHENCRCKPMSWQCWTCNCDARSYPQHIYRCVRQLVVRRNLRKSSNLYAYNVSDLSGNLMRPYIAEWFSTYETLLNPVDINQGDYIDIQANDKYLFIGRLSEEKGIRDFCKVMTELGLHGIVLGEGYLKEELEKTYPNIHFAGWVNNDDKMQYVAQAKCLVFPSTVHETFGLTVAEMLSYGVPVIMPTGCGASFLIKDGANGFIFPMNDYQALKKSIQKFECVNLRDFMESTRQSFDRFHYTREAYIKNLEIIFKEL